VQNGKGRLIGGLRIVGVDKRWCMCALMAGILGLNSRQERQTSDFVLLSSDTTLVRFSL
jgi:hypothetical protein